MHARAQSSHEGLFEPQGQYIGARCEVTPSPITTDSYGGGGSSCAAPLELLKGSWCPNAVVLTSCSSCDAPKGPVMDECQGAEVPPWLGLSPERFAFPRRRREPKAPDPGTPPHLGHERMLLCHVCCPVCSTPCLPPWKHTMCCTSGTSCWPHSCLVCAGLSRRRSFISGGRSPLGAQSQGGPLQNRTECWRCQSAMATCNWLDVGVSMSSCRD